MQPIHDYCFITQASCMELYHRTAPEIWSNAQSNAGLLTRQTILQSRSCQRTEYTIQKSRHTTPLLTFAIFRPPPQLTGHSRARQPSMFGQSPTCMHSKLDTVPLYLVSPLIMTWSTFTGAPSKDLNHAKIYFETNATMDDRATTF